LLLYYITDRNRFRGNAAEKERRLLERISACAAAGVDYVQLREKDLSVRDLQTLATKAVAAIPAASRTRLLINSRIDVALASGAHGVHLPARDISATEAPVRQTPSSPFPHIRWKKFPQRKMNARTSRCLLRCLKRTESRIPRASGSSGGFASDPRERLPA
jgi:hypothetical protein